MSATEWCSTIVPLDNGGDDDDCDDDVNDHDDDKCKGTSATDQKDTRSSVQKLLSFRYQKTKPNCR